MKYESISVSFAGNLKAVCVYDTWLDAESWEFIYTSRHELKLVKWMKLNKPTKRHKYKVVSVFNWYDRNRSSYTGLQEPPIAPDEVIEAVKDKFMEDLKVILNPTA